VLGLVRSKSSILTRHTKREQQRSRLENRRRLHGEDWVVTEMKGMASESGCCEVCSMQRAMVLYIRSLCTRLQRRRAMVYGVDTNKPRHLLQSMPLGAAKACLLPGTGEAWRRGGPRARRDCHQQTGDWAVRGGIDLAKIKVSG